MRNGAAAAILILAACCAFAQEADKSASTASLPTPSAEFKKPGTKAFRAIARIQFIDPTPEDGYAARTLDAEKALDDAKDASDTDADTQIVKLLKATLTMKKLGHEDFTKYGLTAMQCVNELYAIFDPESQNDKMKELAAKRSCLSDSKRLLDTLYSAADKSLK